MKKILMILDNAFKPDLRVKKEIETLVSFGFYIDLICWDQDSNLKVFEDLGNYSIHRVKLKVEKQIGTKKIIYLFNFFKNVKNYLLNKNKKYEYIYVHDFLMLPIGLYFQRKYKNKLIYDAHEIYHLMEWEKYPNIISNLIYGVERFLISRSDFFIVVSEYRKAFYAQKLKKKINVIGNWYDEYEGNSINLRTTLNINPSKTIIAYFGVLNFKVRPINKIFDYVNNSNDFHLIIGGAGVDQETIKEYIKNYRNISYLGWLANVREYMDSIDYLLYFMNSNRKYFYYSAPNSLYLAISHCKPLITNVEGEPKDIIQKYDIGVFLSDIENIPNLKLANSDSYKNMVSNIEKIKGNYIWKNSIEVYKQIFFRNIA